jgi:hypothetical protein
MSKELGWIAVIVLIVCGNPGVAAFLGVMILLS